MQTIFELIFSYLGSFGAKALVDCGIMDALKKGDASAAKLADECHLSEDYVTRLLRDLLDLNLYQEGDNGYQPTEKGSKVLDEKKWLEWLSRENIENLWDAIDNNKKDTILSILLEAKNDETGILHDALDTLSLQLFVKFNLTQSIPLEAITIEELSEKTHYSEPLLTLILNRLSKHKAVKLVDNIVSGDKEFFQDLSKLEKVVIGESRIKWIASSYIGQMQREKKDAYAIAFKMPVFEYLKQNARERKLFDDSMAETTSFENQLIADTLSVGDEKEVVDIGGGTGAFLTAFLEKNSNLSGAVFDLEESLKDEEVSRHFQRFNQRFRTISGNFFKPETIPEMNCAMIKRVIHDWPDHKALNILKNISCKCKRLFIVEWLFNGGKFMSRVDLLLLGMNGKLRTEEEFAKLLSKADFQAAPRKAFKKGFSLGYIEASSLKPELTVTKNM